MVNFAELKAKAEKAKDASVTKMTNTRDRFSSTPSSKVNWDPNWKRAPPLPPPSAASTNTGGPPPPMRPRPGVMAPGVGAASPVVPYASRATDAGDEPPVPSSYTPLPPPPPPPPPTRAVSGYPPRHRDTSQDAVDRIDWANLSAEDKQEFFGWMDAFFARYLGIELGPRAQRLGDLSVQSVQRSRPPPAVNMGTRPQGS